MFVIGSNMAETHPVIAQIVKEHQKFNGAKLIVCDPRCTGLARHADIYIQHIPGTDVALLNGIMSHILKEGLENKTFIEGHTEGYEGFCPGLQCCFNTLLQENKLPIYIAKSRQVTII